MLYRYYFFSLTWVVSIFVSFAEIEIPSARVANSREERLEDEYLLHHNDTDPTVMRDWTAMRTLWFGDAHDKMKEFCKKFHEIAGKGILNASKLIVQLNMNYVRCRGKNNREFARIDVLKYYSNDTLLGSAEDEDEDEIGTEPKYYFITKGLEPNCVYYLDPTDDTCMEFFLDYHVCEKPILITSSTVSTTPNFPKTRRSTTSSVTSNSTQKEGKSTVSTTPQFPETRKSRTSSATSNSTQKEGTISNSTQKEGKILKTRKSTTSVKSNSTQKEGTISKSPKSSKSPTSVKSEKSSRSRKSPKSSKSTTALTPAS